MRFSMAGAVGFAILGVLGLRKGLEAGVFFLGTDFADNDARLPEGMNFFLVNAMWSERVRGNEKVKPGELVIISAG